MDKLTDTADSVLATCAMLSEQRCQNARFSSGESPQRSTVGQTDHQTQHHGSVKKLTQSKVGCDYSTAQNDRLIEQNAA